MSKKNEGNYYISIVLDGFLRLWTGIEGVHSPLQPNRREILDALNYPFGQLGYSLLFLIREITKNIIYLSAAIS